MWEVYFLTSQKLLTLKVWNSGFSFKLHAYGVEGELLALLEDYLHNREQRVV